MIELVYALGIFSSFYIAWCLGANDAANPTECAVGGGVISIRKALILFAIFAAVGGILIGPFVTKTIDRGIVNRTAAVEGGELTVEVLIVGSFTAVLAALLWLILCTWRGMPVSTTHSIIGGVFGFGLITVPGSLMWDKIGIIVLGIFLSPILSILTASSLFFSFRKYFGKKRGERWNLLLVFLLVLVLSFTTSATVLNKALGWKDLVEITVMGLTASLALSSFATVWFWKRYEGFHTTGERTLAYLLVIALCFSAFAFGGNDMANATGAFVTPTEEIVGTPTFETMVLLAMIGSVGVAAGGFTWGYRVIRTSAFKVTRLDPLTSAAAEFSNALTIFLFTVAPKLLIGFGIPVSTTHSSIGSIIGVGLSRRGLGGIHHATTWKIMLFWALTIPCTALISMGLFRLFGQVIL